MPTNRRKSGIITGIIGLICNLTLSVGKLVAGLLTGSVSIMSDAANNLSDCGASIVTVSSFALSGKKADREHPFGHGRYEYIASFVIGFIIVVVGVQFIIESIKRIINPVSVEMNTFSIIVLSTSIALKAIMAVFYRTRAALIKSDALKAAAADSLFDCIVTSFVLVSFFLGKAEGLNIDGVCGLIVALLIIVCGVKIVLSTLNKLLGNGCDPQLTQKLYEIVLCDPQIKGAHDLYVHDYGPNRRIGTVHAEFVRDISITEAHKIIDKAEKKALELYGVELCVHVDPIDFSDPKLNSLRDELKKVLAHYHDSSLHELNVNYDEKTVAFDVGLPQKYCDLCESITSTLKTAVGQILEGFDVEIGFDIIYNTK